MNKWVRAGCLKLAVLMIAPGVAHAQQATERYIPIGKSPGVSSEESFIGTITDIDYTIHEMEVRSPEGRKAVRPAEFTRYYLDRTKRKMSNQTATFRDCEVGLKVEIKIKADGSVDWIKIESG